VSFIVQVRVVVGGAHDARNSKRRYGPEVMRGAALRRVVDAVRRSEGGKWMLPASSVFVGATSVATVRGEYQGKDEARDTGADVGTNLPRA